MLSSGQLTTGSRLDTSQVLGSQGLYSPKVAGPHALEWSEMHALRSGTDGPMRCTSPKEDFTLTSFLAVSFSVTVKASGTRGTRRQSRNFPLGGSRLPPLTASVSPAHSASKIWRENFQPTGRAMLGISG